MTKIISHDHCIARRISTSIRSTKKLSAMFFTMALLIVSSLTNASVSPVTFDSSATKIKKPRWMFESEISLKAKNRGVVGDLEKVKRYQMSERFKTCRQLAISIYGKVSSLAPWVAVVELDCATNGFKRKKVSASQLNASIQRVDRNKSWVLDGPQKEELRKKLVLARFALFKNDFRLNRKRAWRTIDTLMGVREWLSKSQKADLFGLAGELAFIEQKMVAAQNYVLQSLELRKSSRLQEKLVSIHKALAPDQRVIREESSAADFSKEATEMELLLEKRIRQSMAKGELVSVAEDSVTLLKKFPGGRRADWAFARAQEALLRSLQNDDAPKSERKRILRAMGRADGLRLKKWAIKIYWRGYYPASKELADSAYEKLEDTEQGRDVLLILGKSKYYLNDGKGAEKAFNSLVKNFAGTKEAVESQFFLGLLKFRQKKFPQAAVSFQKIFSLPEKDRFELSARYWLWRSYSLSENPRANESRDDLIQRFPLTYYGLRARAERDGELVLPEKSKSNSLKSEVWLTDKQRMAWERLQLLLRAGWIDEAQEEIAVLPPAFTKQQKTALSQLWALAFAYPRTIRLLSSAFSQEERWAGAEYIHLSYPREFTRHLDSAEKKLGVDENLLRGLIRQESAYSMKAVSWANAHGLMQLIPGTAKDMARRLKLKDLEIPEDLYDAETNIKLGSEYIANMIRMFDGHVPMGLAAYNAGPGRVRRWLRQRPGFKEIYKNKTSDPMAEVWIEELPWSETVHYVKAILRNYLVYSLLEKQKIKLNEPIWAYQPEPKG